MTPILDNAEIVRLLKKYGIILIVFDILSRFGLSFGLQFYYTIFPFEDMIRADELYSLLVHSISILMNLVMAIVLLFDMDGRARLTWIIFTLTLFSPWTSVLFFIVWRSVETKNKSTTTIEP